MRKEPLFRGAIRFRPLRIGKNVLVLRDSLTRCSLTDCSLACCSSAFLHHVAVCLRAPDAQLLPRLSALLFQLLRWWWLTLLANRSSFYAASRVTCSRGIQHESDWCSASVVLNDEPDWSTVLVSWRSVESNKGISWRSAESNKGISWFRTWDQQFCLRCASADGDV